MRTHLAHYSSPSSFVFLFGVLFLAQWRPRRRPCAFNIPGNFCKWEIMIYFTYLGLLPLRQAKEFKTLKNLLYPILLSSYFSLHSWNSSCHWSFSHFHFLLLCLYSPYISYSSFICLLHLQIPPYSSPFLSYSCLTPSHQSSSDAGEAAGRQTSLTPNFSFSLQLPGSSASCLFQDSLFEVVADTLNELGLRR